MKHVPHKDSRTTQAAALPLVQREQFSSHGDTHWVASSLRPQALNHQAVRTSGSEPVGTFEWQDVSALRNR